MMSHIAARPHQFGRDYAGLQVAQESRLLCCKLCSDKFQKVVDPVAIAIFIDFNTCLSIKYDGF